MMEPRAFRIHAGDNVATLIEDAPAGRVACLGPGEEEGGLELVALGPIARGHKISLVDIAEGEAVVKFGVRIGRATRPIPRGSWVHLHNLASDLDERSGTFDAQTGAPSDTDSAYV